MSLLATGVNAERKSRFAPCFSLLHRQPEFDYLIPNLKSLRMVLSRKALIV
jgi:hypothetical protein